MSDTSGGNPQRIDEAESVVPASRAIRRRFLEAEGWRPMILFFWAAMVGCAVGLVATAFQGALAAVTEWRESSATTLGGGRVLWWLVPSLVSAVLVGLAFVLVRRFAPEASGSGVQEIEGVLDELRPLRWQRVLPVKFVAGICSLGGGMVLGREGPTVHMGGSLGKLFGDVFKLSAMDVHTLVAAGAGAGISAAFNAPLAGILFVIEEMRPQFKYNFLSVHAVLICTATATIVVRAILGQTPDIEMELLDPAPLESLWLFPLLGVFFGIVGVIFNKLLIWSLDAFSRLERNAYALTGVIVGAGVGLIGALYPHMVGGGYEIIPLALTESLSVNLLLALFVGRFLMTMVCYGSGAPGGIFAPMLALATLFGMWAGHYAHAWWPELVAHPQVFAVAGMGALFSATVRAPLTGIALSIEMTGNYSLIVPLILTCMVAAIVSQGLGGRPIYTVLLKRTLSRAERVGP